MDPDDVSDRGSVVSEHLDEEGDDGDDLYGDAYLEDYEPDPELDQYETDDLVEDVTEHLTVAEAVEARRRAEEEMDARDRVRFRRHTLGQSLP